MEELMTKTVKLKKLYPQAIIPTYGTAFSAGADLYACLEDTVTIHPKETQFIHTGIALEIPTELVGLIYARSGLACKKGVAPANKVGVIDSDYRGEIIVALYNHSDDTLEINHGDRIAQLVLTPYVTAQFEETEYLKQSQRGSGGFGSTGKN